MPGPGKPLIKGEPTYSHRSRDACADVARAHVYAQDGPGAARGSFSDWEENLLPLFDDAERERYFAGTLTFDS